LGKDNINKINSIYIYIYNRQNRFKFAVEPIMNSD